VNCYKIYVNWESSVRLLNGNSTGRVAAGLGAFLGDEGQRKLGLEVGFKNRMRNAFMEGVKLTRMKNR